MSAVKTDRQFRSQPTTECCQIWPSSAARTHARARRVIYQWRFARSKRDNKNINAMVAKAEEIAGHSRMVTNTASGVRPGTGQNPFPGP